MSSETPHRVRERLLDAMRIESFHPPAESAAIPAAETKLGVVFPEWLRELYLACNGFLGPTHWGYLLPLDGSEGLVEFTEFLRTEDWAPPWMARAIVFGGDTGSGSLTTYFVALDGNLITWTIGEGSVFKEFEGTVFDLYQREQQLWDDADASSE